MRRAIVEISPGLIRLLVTNGAQVLALGERTIDLSASNSDGASALNATLQSGTESLSDLTRECNAIGLSAVVVLHGTGNTLNTSSAVPANGQGSGTVVQSCPRKSGPRAAREAALLALDAATTLDRTDSPNASFVVATDPDRIHAVAFAMADQIVARTQDLVTKAGLKFTGTLPGEAVCTTGCFDTALRSGNPKEASDHAEAFIWIDQASASLCVASSGRLLLTRSISIGLDALVDSLSKPVRGTDHPVACVRFDRAGSRRLLLSIGIPHAGATVDGHADLTGASLLPLMQPVLQRIAVEIKQTVRFGLPEEHRRNLTLKVIGPASQVPRLDDVLAALSGLNTDRLSERLADDSKSSATTIHDIAPHALRSLSDRELTHSRRIRAAALAGTLAVLAWVGLTSLGQHADTNLLRNELLLHQAAADAARAQLAQAQQASTIRAASRSFESRIASTVGSAIEWPAVLVWLASNTQPGIRFSLIECDSKSDSPVLRLAGIARNSDRATVNNDISSLLAQLREWPPADKVELRSTEVHSDANGSVGSFEISVTLASIPAQAGTLGLTEQQPDSVAASQTEDRR